MVSGSSLEPFAHASATISVHLAEAAGSVSLHEIPAGEFDVGEHGVTIGSLFVPWRRVIRYDWTMRQEFVASAIEARPKAQVRVVVDGAEGEPVTFTIPADRFETGAWTITMLVDRHVEPEAGVLVVQKIFVPWERVIEFERMHGAGSVPARPDVATDGPTGTETGAESGAESATT